MTNDLDHWRARLEGHYAALDDARSKYDLPVFALEHGLDQAELARLKILLYPNVPIGRLSSRRNGRIASGYPLTQ